MIRATNKTIMDYLNRPDPTAKPTSRHLPDNRSFKRMILAAYQPDNQPHSNPGQGLTVQDYMRQTVSAVRPAPVPATSGTPHAPSTGNQGRSSKLWPNAQETAAPSDAGEQSAVRRRIDHAVAVAARKYNLPTQLLQSVIRHESNFNPRAVSHAGACGLMQLMPATASELGVTDPFDIRQNIDGGSRYLKKMLDQFDGDLRKALAAYNAGPGTVRRYGDVPPYPETRAYIRKVLTAAGEVT